jgi:ParB family chromosome partitioning protein
MVMAETLASGSAVVEAVGLHLGVAMKDWWEADTAFFELIRDREVLTAIVAEVAGDLVARSNRNEKSKTLKTIVRDHLEGTNGRDKVEGWVPRWMGFPPAAYTARGGVGTVSAHARAEAARAQPGDPDPDTPPPPSNDALASPEPEAALPASAAMLPEPERLAA